MVFMSNYVCLRAATALLCAACFIGIQPLKAVNSLVDTTGSLRSEAGWEILDLSPEAATTGSLRFEGEWEILDLSSEAQRHISENSSCVIGSDGPLAFDLQSGSQDTDEESVPTVQLLLLMGVLPELLSDFDACDAAKANGTNDAKESDLLRAFIEVNARLSLDEETKEKLCNDLIAFKRRAYQDKEHFPSETWSLLREYFKHKYGVAAYTQKDTALHPVVDAVAQALETDCENVSKPKLLALARTLSQPGEVVSSETLSMCYRESHQPRWIQPMPEDKWGMYVLWKERVVDNSVRQCWAGIERNRLNQLWGNAVYYQSVQLHKEEVAFYREGQSVTAPVSIDYGALFEPTYMRLLLEEMMRFPSIGAQDPLVMIKDAQWQERSQKSWTGHHKFGDVLADAKTKLDKKHVASVIQYVNQQPEAVKKELWRQLNHIANTEAVACQDSDMRAWEQMEMMVMLHKSSASESGDQKMVVGLLRNYFNLRLEDYVHSCIPNSEENLEVCARIKNKLASVIPYFHHTDQLYPSVGHYNENLTPEKVFENIGQVTPSMLLEQLSAAMSKDHMSQDVKVRMALVLDPDFMADRFVAEEDQALTSLAPGALVVDAPKVYAKKKIATALYELGVFKVHEGTDARPLNNR